MPFYLKSISISFLCLVCSTPQSIRLYLLKTLPPAMNRMCDDKRANEKALKIRSSSIQAHASPYTQTYWTCISCLDWKVCTIKLRSHIYVLSLIILSSSIFGLIIIITIITVTYIGVSHIFFYKYIHYTYNYWSAYIILHFTKEPAKQNLSW